jgi:hypothetical protein
MMNEANHTKEKSIYQAPTWRLFGSDAVTSMDAHSVRMCVACKSCRGQKQETDQRLAEEKNKKKKCPPPGFMFDR